MSSIAGSADSLDRSAQAQHIAAAAEPPPAQGVSGATGAEIVDRHTSGSHADINAVALDLKDEIGRRPQEATRLTLQAMERLNADDRDEVAQEFIRVHSDAELQALGATDAGRGALALAVNELAQGAVHRDEADDARRVGQALGAEIDIEVNTGWARVSGVLHTVLDFAGFIPGLGAVPDLINAGLYAAEGDWDNAALAGVAAIPLAGDAVKGGSMAVRAGSQALELGARHGDEALGAGGALLRQGDDALDAARRGTDDVAENTAENAFEATVRGERVTLAGVETRSVDYVKRDRASYDQLRRDFNSTERRNFLQSLANDPQQVAALRHAGLDDAAIARIADGKVPQGWQVHHKLPLDDGGTNAADNLVLIKNDPCHIGITNAQQQLVGHLQPGQSARVDWPVVPGSVYPPQ